MKITPNNINELPISEKEKNLLTALLVDLEEINEICKKNLYIDWQNWHNEYSPERVDPCPDYYGYYTIKHEHSQLGEYDPHIGDYCTLSELDSYLCLLYGFVNLNVN